MTRTLATVVALVAMTGSAPDAGAQPAPAPAYTSGFIDTGGARIYYLDHGGSGLPVVLDGYTAEGLAPRLVDEHRVVSITLHRPSDSGPEPGAETVAAQARELLDFLGAFEFERAVLIGAFYSRSMTYLAEHHPDRLAGLVYMTGAPEVVDYVELDPTGGYQLFLRALPREFSDDVVEGMEYRPRYLGSDASPILVPALAFAPRTGELSPAFDLLTDGAGMANLPFFQDAEARAYFERLAADEALRAQVAAFQDDVVGPRMRAHDQAFRRAFGENLHVETVDVPRLGRPALRTSPELFYPVIERFLDAVREEASRP